MTRFFTNLFHVVSTELLTSSPDLLLNHSIHIHGHIRDHSHSHGRSHHSHSTQHQQTSCRSIHGHTHVHILRNHIRGRILHSRSIQHWYQRTSCHSNRGGHIRRSRNRVRILRIHHSSHSRVRQQRWPQLPSCRSIHGRSRVRSHHSHN